MAGRAAADLRARVSNYGRAGPLQAERQCGSSRQEAESPPHPRPDATAPGAPGASRLTGAPQSLGRARRVKLAKCATGAERANAPGETRRGPGAAARTPGGRRMEERSQEGAGVRGRVGAARWDRENPGHPSPKLNASFFPGAAAPPDPESQCSRRHGRLQAFSGPRPPRCARR